MRPRHTRPTDCPGTSRTHPEQRAVRRRRAGGKRPHRRFARPWTTIRLSGLVATLVAAALASAAAAPAGSTWPTKRDARRIAVRVTVSTCTGVSWCRGSSVVPARRCRRAPHRTVYCAMAFITAQHQRCAGVVGVSKVDTGRLDSVMAMPQDCSRDNDPGATPTNEAVGSRA